MIGWLKRVIFVGRERRRRRCHLEVGARFRVRVRVSVRVRVKVRVRVRMRVRELTRVMRVARVAFLRSRRRGATRAPGRRAMREVRLSERHGWGVRDGWVIVRG